MDALSETPRAVHLVGAIFIQGRFAAPWYCQTASADAAALVLEPSAEPGRRWLRRRQKPRMAYRSQVVLAG